MEKGIDSTKSNKKELGEIEYLLLIFLAIPIVAFIAALIVESKLNSNLEQVFLEEFPEQSEEIVGIKISNFCNMPDVRSDIDMAEVCNLSDNIGLMKFGAIVAGLLGIILLAGIKIAGKLAGGSRTLLVLIFKPLLHITMLLLSVLIVLHAALGIAAIYYGESALVGRVHVGIIFGLGIGAFFGVLSMIHAQFSIVKKATTIVLGKKLDLKMQSRLCGFVDELANKMGVSRPDSIVVGLEPNFYVTEANVVCLDGKLNGRTMYLSLPLCRILSIDELGAVMGHELAHYKGLDTRFSKKFYPIYRGLVQGLINLAPDSKGEQSIVIRPAFATLAFFLNTFSGIENKIGRERELVADDEGSKTSTAKDLVTSLVKLNAFSEAWLVIRHGMRKALGEGKQFINVSSLFVDLVKNMKKEKALDKVSEEGPVHPTDSHPPLSQRMKNLKITLPEVIDSASDITPSKPAIDLIIDAESLEKDLTNIEHALMARNEGINLDNKNPENSENNKK